MKSKTWSLGWNSEADDIQYEDSDGNVVTQDLGYGFIGTEKHFTTSVSNEIDNILIDVESDIYNNQEVINNYTISTNEKNYEAGEAIPLEVGVNKLTVTCTAAVGKPVPTPSTSPVVPQQNRPPSRSRTAHPYWLCRDAKS